VTADHLVIENSRWRGVGVGEGARLTATETAVRGTAEEGGVLVREGATARFTDCEVADAAEEGVAAISGGTLVFTGGRLTGCGCGATTESGATMTLDGTLLTANECGACPGPDSEMTLLRCTITGNEGSGVLAFRGARVHLDGTVSRDNREPDEYDAVAEDDEQATAAASVPAPAGGPPGHPGAAPPGTGAPGAASPSGSAAPPGRQGEDAEALLAELDAMVGLARVKEEIRKLVTFLRMAERRRGAGLPAGPAISRHLVFSGGPAPARPPSPGSTAGSWPRWAPCPAATSPRSPAPTWSVRRSARRPARPPRCSSGRAAASVPAPAGRPGGQSRPRPRMELPMTRHRSFSLAVMTSTGWNPCGRTMT
jgi:hypothetical protein